MGVRRRLAAGVLEGRRQGFEEGYGAGFDAGAQIGAARVLVGLEQALGGRLLEILPDLPQIGEHAAHRQRAAWSDEPCSTAAGRARAACGRRRSRPTPAAARRCGPPRHCPERTVLTMRGYDRFPDRYGYPARASVTRQLAGVAALLGLTLLTLALLLRSAGPAVPGRGWWPGSRSPGVIALAVAALGLRARSASAGTVLLWARRSRRNSGVASSSTPAVEGVQAGDAPAGARVAAVARGVPWWRRWRCRRPSTRCGWRRSARSPSTRPVEDVTLRVGGPRTGKSGEMAGRIADAPGAVIATSTRLDLLDRRRAAARRERGPVHVFNPSGLGGIASTVTFDPLSGLPAAGDRYARAEDCCARRRRRGTGGAGVLGRPGPPGAVRRCCTPPRSASASMRDVLTWVADPDAAKRGGDRATCAARPEPAYVADVDQFLTTNDRTRSSITSTIMPALSWLTADAAAAAAADAGDVRRRRAARARGTVFMLGAEDGQVAPLVAALTGHIAREARRLAGCQPGGRLDPPLTLALDEAALICPVPLDQWTADMGGRGVTIHIAVQSRAQLRQRWGDTARRRS